LEDPHVVGTEEETAERTTGCVMVTVVVAVQPLASVAVTV
jgi:hypothetical protein